MARRGMLANVSIIDRDCVALSSTRDKSLMLH